MWYPFALICGADASGLAGTTCKFDAHHAGLDQIVQAQSRRESKWTLKN